MTLPVPTSTWSSIAIDFMGPIPHTTKRAMNYIMVIMCRLTAMCRLIPLSKLTTLEIAKALKKFYIPYYSLPDDILSDRDVRFTAGYWRELMRLLGVHLTMATSYHQNTNGQLE